MDWEAYKRHCDAPDVFSRWMLEETSELLSGEAHSLLKRSLEGIALAKPTDHKGGSQTDMFTLELSHAEAVEVYERVASAVAAGETTSRTAGRGLGGFEEAWREYVHFLETARVL